jgi:hypothetical protein
MRKIGLGLVVAMAVALIWHYAVALPAYNKGTGVMLPADKIVAIVDDTGKIIQIKVKDTGEVLNINDYKYLNNGVRRQTEFDEIAHKAKLAGMTGIEKVKYIESLAKDITSEMREFSAGVKKSNQKFKDLAKEEGWEDVSKLFDDPNDPMNRMDEYDATTNEVEVNAAELVKNLKNKKEE